MLCFTTQLSWIYRGMVKRLSFKVANRSVSYLPLGFGKVSLHLFADRLINVQVFSSVFSDPENRP